MGATDRGSWTPGCSSGPATNTLCRKMTTTSTPPAEAPPRAATARRVALVIGAVVLVVLLAGGGLLLGARAARGGVLPNLELAGRSVSGLSEEELRELVREYAEERAAETVTVRRATLPEEPDEQADLVSRASELGYELDVDATVEAVLQRGRQGNPVAALTDHVRATFSEISVPAVEDVDQQRLEMWSMNAAEALTKPSRRGDVTIEGTEVVAVQGRPGVELTPEQLVDPGERAAAQPGEETLDVEGETLPVDVQVDGVDQTAQRARTALSGAVTLTRNDEQATLEPEQIASVLEITRTEAEDGSVDLGLRTDPEAVTAALGDVSRFEGEPVSADVSLTSGGVQISESQQGFSYDANATAERLLEVATGDGERQMQVQGAVTEPERSTEDAQALGIVEPVASFTTSHDCCENRVTNIHRIAEIVDGVVLEPGETFSVNGYVGRRTVEKGFVADGAISGGEYVEAVGGGVSQFATTLYNAAFFSGIEIPDFKPHSQYISRYPEGREATINYPNVDLVLENNSPYGILIDTSYTSTSITVTMWSTKWAEVSADKSERRNFTEPETIRRTNPELPAGEEQVVQSSSGTGFTVTITRQIDYLEGGSDTETYATTYVARPEIVEVGV